MIDEVKIMLGNRASNYTDAQIGLCLKMAKGEVESYCKRKIDTELELIVEQIAIIKLNRLGTEGLSAESFSGVSQNYIDGYPAEIQDALKRKRKIKVM